MSRAGAILRIDLTEGKIEKEPTSRYMKDKQIEALASFPQPGRPKGAELKKIQEDYCRIRGYDPETGVPIREKLEKLGLKDVADKLGTSVTNE